jgi:hypothetical protein
MALFEASSSQDDESSAGFEELAMPLFDSLYKPVLFRRVEIWDTEKEEAIVFLSNLLAFGATTIAAIYKDRWQIELFFKSLKQTLKIKTFVGTSANAVRTQVWTALIAMLVLKYLQLKSQFPWSLSTLAALLRQQLFFYRDLWVWLDDPFQAPPALAGVGLAQQTRNRLIGEHSRITDAGSR